MVKATHTGDVISPKALQIIDAEPRVADVTLATALGFKRPRGVRELIERNREEVESFGSLAVRHGKSRGQDFSEYWLTESQSLLVAILSQAPKAPEVRRALIEVFVAWRRGHEPQVSAHDAQRPPVAMRPKKNAAKIRFWKFRFAEAAANLDALGVDVGAIDLGVVTAFGRVIGGDSRMLAKRH